MHFRFRCDASHPLVEWTYETVFSLCPRCSAQRGGTIDTSGTDVPRPMSRNIVRDLGGRPMQLVVNCVATAAVIERIDALLTFDHAVALLDKRYRAVHIGAGAPAPTPTRLRIGCNASAQGYVGNAELRITAGAVALFNSPACDVLYTATFDGTHPLALPNLVLAAGLDLYVLGTAQGPARLELHLDADPQWDVRSPARAAVTIVELTLDAYSHEPSSRLLTAARRIVNGHVLGVPGVNARSPRTKLVAQPSAPSGHGRLRVHVPLADAGAVTWLGHAIPDAHDVDGIGVSFDDARREAWLEGAIVAGHPVWIGLGLELPDHTLLEYGDCVRVDPVALAAISWGLEWEVNNLDVDRRHAAHAAADKPRAQKLWEGLPSKATAVTRQAGRMKLDTEVSSTGSTYGEFVLGPAYSLAQIETYLDEVRQLHAALDLHKIIVVANPAPILARVHPFNPWMPLGEFITLEIRMNNWGGTMQGSFAAPLWLLPWFLAGLDHDGIAAKTRAEQAAEADVRIDDHVLGLICACEYYIEKLVGSARIGDDDGPKVATPIMFRSDFHAMWTRLTTLAQQQGFAAWVAGHGRRGDVLMPQGYKLANAGPGIGAWLDSIIAPGGADNKDDMSPPPGYPRHNTAQPIPYGMGVLQHDAITGHVICEYRPLGNVNTYRAFTEQAFAWAERILVPGVRTWIRTDIGSPFAPPPVGVPQRTRGRPRAVTYTQY